MATKKSAVIAELVAVSEVELSQKASRFQCQIIWSLDISRTRQTEKLQKQCFVSIAQLWKTSNVQ